MWEPTTSITKEIVDNILNIDHERIEAMKKRLVDHAITNLFLQAPDEVLALSREYLLNHLLPPTFSQEEIPPAGIIADYYEDHGMIDEMNLFRRIANL